MTRTPPCGHPGRAVIGHYQVCAHGCDDTRSACKDPLFVVTARIRPDTSLSTHIGLRWFVDGICADELNCGHLWVLRKEPRRASDGGDERGTWARQVSGPPPTIAHPANPRTWRMAPGSVWEAIPAPLELKRYWMANVRPEDINQFRWTVCDNKNSCIFPTGPGTWVRLAPGAVPPVAIPPRDGWWETVSGTTWVVAP